MAERIQLKDRSVRFWARVLPVESGCWEWQGYRDEYGYGRFDESKAHRFSYALTVGSPEGFLVLHRCDNPACVRPDHLFLGTQLDNMRDMISKGRQTHPHWGKTHCKAGHPLSGDNLTVSKKTGSGTLHRACKICKADGMRRYRQRRKIA